MNIEEQMAMAAREIAALHASPSPVIEPEHNSLPPQKVAKAVKNQSRRGLLRKGLGVAVATVGAGALLGMEAGTSLASSSAHPDVPGNFSSNDGTTPAVTAAGTNNSPGVVASSDTYHGVVGSTQNGGGVVGNSGTGTGGYFFSYTATGLTGRTKTGIACQATCDDPTKGIALQVIGHIQVQSDSAGTAALAANAPSVVVTSTAVSPSSQIHLTPTGKLKALWAVPGSGSFTIHTAGAHPAVNVFYLIIN